MVLLLVVGGYLLFSAGSRALQTYRLAGQEAQVRGEIAKLQRHQRQLVALREFLRSDEYIEGVARRILGLVRPGETLVIVSGPEPAADEEGEEGMEEIQVRPGQTWWEALFGP
jgi:cell division protein FtsB